MKKDTHINSQQEVNLKLFLQKVYNHKWFLILSICTCVAIAFAYILVATPKYQASTSILIDPSGNNRVLGGSKYIEGGVSLIEMEKNLYNEIGIIKSFSLIRQTVEDLGFNISYYSKNWLKIREHYKYFPFEITLLENEAQIINVPFEVEILDNNKFKLSIEVTKFNVLNPSNGITREVKRDLVYSQIFSFGEEVKHEYFNFIVKKPNYKVNIEDFNELELGFMVQNLDAVANSYLSNLEVNNIDIQASIFKITTQGPVINKEIDFLKRLTENYVQNKLVSRNETASVKETFIRNQLRIISDSLSKAELDLEKYKKDKRALNLGETATNALDRTSDIEMEMAKIRLNIKYYNSLIENVEANRDKEDFIIPTSVDIEDPLINESIIELKNLYAERSKKRNFVTESNQEMRILNEQIKASTGLLLSNLRNAVKSSEFALERAYSQLSDYDGVIKSLPERENQLLNIQRQSTLYENLFNYLSQELAKAGIARAENISDTRVLDTARMAGDGPVAPQKMLLLVLAAIIGTIIPLAWMILFASNDVIENSTQITANTHISLIANITKHDMNSKNRSSSISLWKVKESFRNLSANLQFIRPKKKCCVIGITSIVPKEGKTFCAINLGITFAETGLKTLIIDADFRNPSPVEGIKDIKGKGLSSYLQGDIGNLNDIIYPYSKLKNLKFIPTSVIEGDNIHELLSGEKMKSVIHELSQVYDYIILDTPPVGLVSDFLLFRDEIDINLFVVRRNLAKIGFLKDFEKLIPRDKKKKSYIIFNDAMDKKHRYGYGYGQMYGSNGGPQLIKDSLSI
jgi:capsular exopolysaccharide synthesis family protein